MKNLKSVIALMLVIVMSALAVSCVNTGDGTSTTTAAGSNTPVSTLEGYDADGYVLDDIPADFQFEDGDNVVRILNWEAEEPEFDVEQDGAGVNDAIWARNQAVEKRLNIELEYTEIAGNNSNRAKFRDTVAAANGRNMYDIIATYSRTAAMCAIDGYFVDYNTIENSYINYEKPWWPETLLETVTIDNSCYFLSGDISTNVLHLMYSIYYNKDRVTEYNLGNLTEMVESYNWTIDKLIELSSGVYQDLNNNGLGIASNRADKGQNNDLDDFYGFCTVDYGVDAFYTGSDLKLIEHDDDKTLIISEDYYSQKADTLVSKLGKWLITEDCCVNFTSSTYADPFVKGNALFCQTRAYFASRNLGEVSFKYGILPTPLYNIAQLDYITVVGNPFTLYGIMKDCKNPQKMTAVIECLASEGYRKTTPAIFYINMQIRHSEGEADARMWDIIKNTIRFDLGRIFANDLQYMSELPTTVACQGLNWLAEYDKYERSLKLQIETIVEKFAAMKANS